MSISVEIYSRSPIRIDLNEICGDRYYYGVRDMYDIVRRGAIDNYLVFFDFMERGRGVEFIFVSENKVELRINAPASTSDLELFMCLIDKLTRIVDTNEVICEGEVYSIDSVVKIREEVEANMRSGLDLLLGSTEESVEIIAVEGPIAIDDEEKIQFKGGQEEFDEYLEHKQSLPGTHEILIPMIAETDKGSIWCLFVKAGRYVILPKYARPRNRNMKVDRYLVFYSGEKKKAIDYRNFLKEVDTSKRYDAERFITKISKVQLKEIFDKYPNELEDVAA